jgi:hypothetical protein
MKRLAVILTVAVLSIGTVKGYLAAKERPERYPCSFRTEKGKLISLDDAQRARLRSVKLGKPMGVQRNEVGLSGVDATIRCVARHYDMAPGPFLHVAKCESGGNPANDSSPTYKGLFQYLPETWANASALFGHKGASIFDGYAQIHVTVQTVKSGGWGPWGICI